MDPDRKITNPGSAIGEAVGALMETALTEFLENLADDYGCHYLTSGVGKTKGDKPQKKLLMFDNYGNDYNIDGVLANESMQPLIIFESKYIRYKKHNRDKGSWICTAHSAVRRRYESIKCSIAVLAGSWSSSSLKMLKSHDVIFFLIPFDFICDLLSEYNVDFRWAEKDRGKAIAAWENFQHLTDEDKSTLGIKMVQHIQDDLRKHIDVILDETIPREIDKIIIELLSSFGELRVFEFDSQEAALDFLGELDPQTAFFVHNSFSLFDGPPAIDDDDDGFAEAGPNPST